MHTKAECSRSLDNKKLNAVIHGHKVIFRFADTPNDEIAELIKRALLDAYMPKVG